MPSREYYTLPIPASSQTRERGELSVNLSELSSLGGDAPVVEQLSQQPGDLRLTVQYRNPYAEEMAGEVKALADSDGFSAVAFFSPSGSTPRDGYYSARSADIQPLQPQERQLQEVEATLTEVGTRETHWLGVETTPVSVDHGFGSDQTARVAVPAASSKRRWYDPDDGTVAPVGTPLETREAEYGDLVIYDVDAGETAVGTGSKDHGPTLLYELSYSDEGVLDPVVWDDHGHAAKLDANNDRQWQHVFTASHEYDGQPILDSGLLRVSVDEAAGELTAEEWYFVVLADTEATTDWTSGTNATVSLVSTPAVEGDAIQGTTDATGTAGNRWIAYTHSSAISIEDTIRFAYHTDNASGSNTLSLEDSTGTSETHDYSSQVTAGEMVYVEIDPANYTTVDLTDIVEVRWVFDGDGTGMDKTITVDDAETRQRWESVALDWASTDWSVFDWDIGVISPTTIRSRATFTHPTEGLYELDAALDRGMDAVRFDIPPNESSPIPSALQTVLDPIASGEVVDMQPTRELVQRSDTQR